MRYLVTARVKPGREADLLHAIEQGTLGAGSVAGDEYLRNMEQARLCSNGAVRWVEVCFCDLPLQEEQPYWEEYFELVQVKDAHARHHCRDLNGTEPWACCEWLRVRLHGQAGSEDDRLGPAVLGSAPGGHWRPRRFRVSQLREIRNPLST
jgi:hypothetical protein